MLNFSSSTVIQIAEQVGNDTIGGLAAEESPVPSTKEFAAFYRINPATAVNGVNLLVNAGVIYKKRGIGMFVVAGAKQLVMARRRDRTLGDFVGPLLAEASKRGITPSSSRT